MAEPRRLSRGEATAIAYARLTPEQQTAFQNEVVRTAGQVNNLNKLLNREEERTYWDGGRWMAPVYSHDNPRRKNGRYRTRNGRVLPSEYESRKSMIDRAVANRLSRIRTKYKI